MTTKPADVARRLDRDVAETLSQEDEDPREVGYSAGPPVDLGKLAAATLTVDEAMAISRVVIAAVEVIASIPATYNENDGRVKRHAAALVALARALDGEE